MIQAKNLVILWQNSIKSPFVELFFDKKDAEILKTLVFLLLERHISWSHNKSNTSLFRISRCFLSKNDFSSCSTCWKYLPSKWYGSSLLREFSLVSLVKIIVTHFFSPNFWCWKKYSIYCTVQSAECRVQSAECRVHTTAYTTTVQ